MPANEKVKRVFKKVSGATLAVVGEAAQGDLIYLGNVLGLTEEEMREILPSLFYPDPDEDIEDHYPTESENEEKELTEE